MGRDQASSKAHSKRSGLSTRACQPGVESFGDGSMTVMTWVALKIPEHVLVERNTTPIFASIMGAKLEIEHM